MKKYMSKRLPQIGVLFAFLLILGFFFFRLTYFNFLVFDENYYVRSATSLFYNQKDENFQHPELSKFLISVPFYFIGIFPFSWRLMTLLFGFGGVVFVYFFGRRIGLTRFQGVVASFLLVGSGSWYVMSRLAMLDIFLAVFVLLAGFFLYRFLSVNNFSRNLAEYHDYKYAWLYILFTGLAGSCKLSGFFTLLFLFGYIGLYLTNKLWVKAVYVAVILVSSFFIYSFVNLAILDFNFKDFYSRNVESLIYHNTAMLPGNFTKDSSASTILPTSLSGTEFKGKLTSGYKGFFRFIFQNEVLYFLSTSPFYDLKGYALSNNQFLATSLFVAALISLISLIGKIIRIRQGLANLDSFPVIEQPVFLFLLLYSLSIVVPWAFIPRVQYAFYYVPAFPFIILWVCLFLFKYTDKRLTIGLLTAYFLYTCYAMQYWIPFEIYLF
jgi:dolichyl-phosphate-mannose--protein O-mannosyl transferase